MKPQPLITVTNVQQSAAFYCTLLGAQPGHGGDEFEQVLIGNDLILQLHASTADANHAVLVDASLPRGNGVVLWFETADFDALLQRIAEHQIALDKDPAESPFARQMECWLHDPDGYQVVIAGPSAYPRQPLADTRDES